MTVDHDSPASALDPLFQALAATTSDLVCVWKPTGEVLWVNVAFERETGLALADVGLRSPRNPFVHPDDLGHLLASMAAFVGSRDRVSQPVDSRIVDAWGRVRAVRAVMHKVPWRGELALLSVARLVEPATVERDEAAEAQRRLRESERRFRRLFDNAADAIYLHDAEGRLVDVNRVACATLGYDYETLRTMTVVDVDCGNDDVDLAPFWESVNARGFGQIESRHRRRDGSTFPVEVRVALVEGEGGPLYFAAARDTTERERLTAERHLRERRLALAISATADAIWEWNVQTDETYYSPRWYEMLGYRDAAFAMNTGEWLARCHPDDVQPTLDVIRDALADPALGKYEVEFRMRAADGSWRWIRARGAVVERTPDGRPRLVSGTNTDITEQRRAQAVRAGLEESLRQAQKMESLGRLAGGVAHDFNNLLTAIGGNVSLALAELPPADPLRELLLEVERAAGLAANLTRQLLAFSRKQMIAPRSLDLNELVRQSQRMLARLLGEDVTFDLALAPALPPAFIDPSQLEQVLVNLCVNARDAMPEGGRLTIATELVRLDAEQCGARAGLAPGAYLRLVVADNGVGMSADVRARLFEPFFTTKSLGKGTGLGMAMVYGAVQQNRGHVEVYSEPGRGTRVEILLPAARGAAEAPRAEPRTQWPTGSEHVMVVEDEQSLRVLAARMLERQGYRVRTYANGGEAIGAVEDADARGEPLVVDLLITDVVMPGLSGRAVAERMRGLRPGVRVLYTSGYAEEVINQHGVLEAGLSLLAKPYNLAELARRVREVLDAPERG